MQGLVDLHHHLVWDMDDGAQTFDESVQMLHRAVQQGVCCVAATCHVDPGYHAFDLQTYHHRLNELRSYAAARQLSVQIVSAAEVFYSSVMPRLLQQGAVPPLGDSWHVLVEFSPHVAYETLCRAAVHIANAGYTMVLAHAERYRCLYWGSRLGRLREEYHVCIQINSHTLMDAGKGLRARWIRKIMQEGWVDIVASDAHNLEQRACNLGECADWLAAQWGVETARRLLIEHPTAILMEKRNLNQRKNA